MKWLRRIFGKSRDRDQERKERAELVQLGHAALDEERRSERLRRQVLEPQIQAETRRIEQLIRRG